LLWVFVNGIDLDKEASLLLEKECIGRIALDGLFIKDDDRCADIDMVKTNAIIDNLLD